MITFDDLHSGTTEYQITNGYYNLSWINAGVMHKRQYIISGYNIGSVSGNYSCFNNGAQIMAISNPRGFFTLYAGVFTSAWNDNLLLTIAAIRSGTIIKTETFVLQVFKSSYLEFKNYSNITELRFQSHGGTLNIRVNAPGEHFALDNLCLFIE